jgi:excinuclease ABC subunit C
VTVHPARPRPGSIPDGPGVYQFHDAGGRVLYVGKAKHLDARLNSYFRDKGLHERTRRMLTEAVSVDWTVCGSELEALVLEASWIRTLQPPYNVALRDASPYPRLALTTRDAVPRLMPWRGERRDGITYFGPYPHIRIRSLMDTVTRVFPVRSCNDAVYRRAELSQRPCLLADLGRCSAPCVGRIDQDAHRVLVEDLASFLTAGPGDRLAATEQAMVDASTEQRFELAARLRDRLAVLRAIGAGQTAQFGSALDADAFCISIDGSNAVLGWARARRGEVVAAGITVFEPDPTLEESRQLEQLLAAHYEDSPTHGEPKELLATVVLDATVGRLAGVRTRVRRPRSGDAFSLVAFAQRQAEEGLRSHSLRRPDTLEDRHGALEELASAIGCERTLRRIEGLDNSHTQGRDTIGGLVSFVDGREVREQFRRLNLSVDTGDDFAAMGELVTRRFTGRRLGLAPAPDLLLIDGGPLQVAAAAKALDDLAVTDRPFIVGLAKRLEELYPEGENDPVLLPRGSAAFHLVTRIRDAVHANAIGAHRRRRDRVRSGLDELSGIGPVRRKALLERFGSLEAVRQASLLDLQHTPGIGPVVAARLHDQLHASTDPTGSDPTTSG